MPVSASDKKTNGNTLKKKTCCTCTLFWHFTEKQPTFVSVTVLRLTNCKSGTLELFPSCWVCPPGDADCTSGVHVALQAKWPSKSLLAFRDCLYPFCKHTIFCKMSRWWLSVKSTSQCVVFKICKLFHTSCIFSLLWGFALYRYEGERRGRDLCVAHALTRKKHSSHSCTRIKLITRLWGSCTLESFRQTCTLILQNVNVSFFIRAIQLYSCACSLSFSAAISHSLCAVNVHFYFVYRPY